MTDSLLILTVLQLVITLLVMIWPKRLRAGLETFAILTGRQLPRERPRRTARRRKPTPTKTPAKQKPRPPPKKPKRKPK